MGGGAGTASPTQGAIMRDAGSVGRTDNSLSPLVRGTRSQGGGEGRLVSRPCPATRPLHSLRCVKPNSRFPPTGSASPCRLPLQGEGEQAALHEKGPGPPMKRRCKGLFRPLQRRNLQIFFVVLGSRPAWPSRPQGCCEPLMSLICPGKGACYAVFRRPTQEGGGRNCDV